MHGNGKGRHEMTTDKASAETTRLAGAEPCIFVSDIAASIDYYTDKAQLRGRIHLRRPALLRPGRSATDARLNLRSVDAPVIDPQQRDREHLLSALIPLARIQPLFEEFRAAGAEFHQLPRTEPWGARTFIVRDPDGNLILFATCGQLTAPQVEASASERDFVVEIA